MSHRFWEIYNTHIERDGSERLLEWLMTTDIETAPASTRFHEAYSGGLMDHSVRVWDELVRLLKAYPEVKVTAETAAICALLHDVCKLNCYKTEMRNKKDENGRWIQVPFYTFDEDFAFGGHGSKSVYLVQKHMPLTCEEAVAINCHMGSSQGDHSVFDAFREYPLAFLLHAADMGSTINF